MIDLKNIGKQFWELYPEYRFKKPYDSLYNPRKLKDSSKQAWYVTAVCKQKGNPFYQMPHAVRMQELIDTGIIKQELVTEAVLQAIKDYPEHVYTRAQRNLDIWGAKLDDLYTYIKDTDWETDSEILIKLMGSSDKMWKMYASIVNEFDKDDAEEQIKGGGQLSASEKGDI